MNEYLIKKSLKTKILNRFRSTFKIPILEQLLVRISLLTTSDFIWKIIPPDYLYPKGSIRFATRKGINYKLDISNVIDHSIYFDYKVKIHESIIEKIKSSTIIFDIGGNIGSSALFYSKIAPFSRIYSFEPHPDTYNCALENLSLNESNNIHLINLGIGNKKENLKMYEVNQHNPGMNRILEGDRNFPYKLIKLDTMANICNELNIEKIDFIKIDVEGFEYAVISSGEYIIRKSKPVILVELDDDHLIEHGSNAKELVSLISSFGYKNLYNAADLSLITTNTNFNKCHIDLLAY